ncbi:IS21 family transposase [bacterium]|nr:IS21 family transposase [bacterium]MBU1916781.1 IS21 family transposase [bacterium]
MAKKVMTMDRYKEIKRLLERDVSVREIARAMKATRRTVRQIRDQESLPPNNRPIQNGPLWAETMDWKEILGEVLDGHPVKYIWEEKAHQAVSYGNFLKQFHKQYPHYKKSTVVHRIFEPGDRCEVDYAGGKIEWVDLKTGVIHDADVFIGILGFSQLIFAYAKENAKSRNFLECHSKMFSYFGGVTKITVPDCLKQGVTRCHIYDPEINTSYQELASHFNTAIVPARPRHPKDKALAEGAVKLVMRYFRWVYRKHTFISLDEINQAVAKVIEHINNKSHSRFHVSRFDRWQKIERSKLSPLPVNAYEFIEWKEAKLHPDSYVSVEGSCYSAPHIHRGKKLKIKLTDRFIEIFHELERIAIHKRSKYKKGARITNFEHLPPNARAYHEATPQNVLCQAKYLNEDLRKLIDGLFQENTIAHLRRAQGFVSVARKEINIPGNNNSRANIKRAIEHMIHYDKIRVPYFKDLLNSYRNKSPQSERDYHIKRKPCNPMLRHINMPLPEIAIKQKENKYVYATN